MDLENPETGILVPIWGHWHRMRKLRRYRSLTSQNTIIADKTKISNTTPPNIPPLTLMTKTHAWDTSHNSLLSLTSDNTHLATNQ
jgi:hypothetical protein